MSKEVLDRILDGKIIAIVRGIPSEDAVNLAEALVKGGINCIEVTFDQSNPALWQKTADTITLLNECLGDRMVFGAGTVTTVELVNIAKNAGAKFIVSPDCEPDVIRATVEAGMVSMPGALTPTEVLQAHKAGADFVKVFPAGTMGAAYLKAIAAPINHVRLLAVGGVNENNVADFMKAGAVGAGVGGNLVNKTWIAEGRFQDITALAKAFVAAVQ